MPKAEEYTYRMLWLADDEVFMGTAAEFPSLSHAADSQKAALEGIVELVADVLADMEERGEHPPIPFGRRPFSGKYALRMSTEQHRRIAMEAAEQGVSINQLLVSRI